MYLTEEEYQKMGYEPLGHYHRLYKRVQTMIDLYTNHYYSFHDFDSDFDLRKQAIKAAIAMQIAYMDETGIETAEDKQHLANISIGRTSINYGGTDKKGMKATPYGLTLDAINILNSVGFGYRGVAYDR